MQRLPVTSPYMHKAFWGKYWSCRPGTQHHLSFATEYLKWLPFTRRYSHMYVHRQCLEVQLEWRPSDLLRPSRITAWHYRAAINTIAIQGCYVSNHNVRQRHESLVNHYASRSTPTPTQHSHTAKGSIVWERQQSNRQCYLPDILHECPPVATWRGAYL